MRQRFAQFMQGRYGADQLSGFLNVILIIFIIGNFFIKSRLLEFAVVLIFLFSYARIFSRNQSRCYKQNQWFLDKTAGIRQIFAREKAYQTIRKDFHIYTCSKCKQKIKIPKGKGKIIVTCPKCGHEFKKRS